ncbi:OLC1v1030197C1, partial [Oldenlandia corymbosa var. corymbosa]
ELLILASGRLHRLNSIPKFAVFQLDERQCEWSEIPGLGKDVVFIGRGSVSISILAFPFLDNLIKSNCIYFKYHHIEPNYLFKNRDMGIYYLEDATAEGFSNIDK